MPSKITCDSGASKLFLRAEKSLNLFFLLMLLKTPSASALLLFFTSHCTLRQWLGFPSNQRLLNNPSAPGWELLTKMPFAVILRMLWSFATCAVQTMAFFLEDRLVPAWQVLWARLLTHSGGTGCLTWPRAGLGSSRSPAHCHYH